MFFKWSEARNVTAEMTQPDTGETCQLCRRSHLCAARRADSSSIKITKRRESAWAKPAFQSTWMIKSFFQSIMIDQVMVNCLSPFEPFPIADQGLSHRSRKRIRPERNQDQNKGGQCGPTEQSCNPSISRLSRPHGFEAICVQEIPARP